MYNFEVYTDGSYYENQPDKTFGGFIVLVDGKPAVAMRVTTSDPKMVSGWSAGGEYTAAAFAIEGAFQMMKAYEDAGHEVNQTLTLYHDNTGVANFIKPPKGKVKPWTPKKDSAKRYVGIVETVRKSYPYHIKFVYVPGHSGNYWNEVVDDIASGRYIPMDGMPKLQEVIDK